MAFWQYGLQGQNAFPSSGSVTRPHNVDEIHNCRIIGSFTLNTNIPIDESYRVLLNTFSLGTQLIIDFVPEPVTYYIPPSQRPVSGVRHRGYLKLRSKLGSEINLGSFTNDSALGYFTETSEVYTPFNIYYQNFHTSLNAYPMPPAKAFPRGGSGAGTTNQLAMVSRSSGCDFYIVGFATSITVGDVQYHYNNPAVYIGTLSNTYLENPAFFDLNQDSYRPDEGSNEGPGDGIPPLPTAPDYPGENDDFPELPTGASAFAFSKLKLFKPTAAQLGDALDILYTDGTDSTIEQILESAKKWWYKPEQYCIALMLSPVDAPTATSEHIKFGRYDSGVFSDVVSSQWVKVNLGSCTIPLKFGSFLDFNPHTKAKIYLPFVGFRNISVSEIMGATLYCEYNIDMLTGAAIAFIKIKKESSNTVVSYAFECNVAFQVPLTSNNYNTVITTLISASVSAAAQNYAGAALKMVGPMNGLGNQELTESGKMTSNSGVLGSFTPAVIIEFPVPSTPSGYSGYRGIPSDVTSNLGSVHGYTVVDYVHLDIPEATEEEINEIELLLKSGVIM